MTTFTVANRILKELNSLIDVSNFSDEEARLLRLLEAPANFEYCRYYIDTLSQKIIEVGYDKLPRFTQCRSTIKAVSPSVVAISKKHPAFKTAFDLLNAEPMRPVNPHKFTTIQLESLKSLIETLEPAPRIKDQDRELLYRSLLAIKNTLLEVLARYPQNLSHQNFNDLALTTLEISAERYDDHRRRQVEHALAVLFFDEPLVNRKRTRSFCLTVGSTIEKVNRQDDTSDVVQEVYIFDEKLEITQQGDSSEYLVLRTRTTPSLVSRPEDAKIIKTFFETAAISEIPSSSDVNRLPKGLLIKFIETVDEKQRQLISLPLLLGWSAAKIKETRKSLKQQKLGSRQISLDIDFATITKRLALILPADLENMLTSIDSVDEEIAQINKKAKLFSDRSCCETPTFNRILASHGNLLASKYSHPLVAEILSCRLSFDSHAQQHYYYFSAHELTTAFRDAARRLSSLLRFELNEFRILSGFGSSRFEADFDKKLSATLAELTACYVSKNKEITENPGLAFDVESHASRYNILASQAHLAILFCLNLRPVANRTEVKDLGALLVIYEKNSNKFKEKSLAALSPRVRKLIEKVKKTASELRDLLLICGYELDSNLDDFFPSRVVVDGNKKRARIERFTTNLVNRFLVENDIEPPKFANSQRHFIANKFKFSLPFGLLEEAMHHKSISSDFTSPLASSSDLEKLSSVADKITKLLDCELIGEK